MPVEKENCIENGMDCPTSPTAVFYSQHEDEEAPPTQTNSKHPRTECSDKLTPAYAGLTEDQGKHKPFPTTDAHKIHRPVTEHVPSISSNTEGTGLPLDLGDRSDHKESSDLDMSMNQVESLRGESSSFIVPVSPTPRDQHLSYSAHTLSKVRAVKESLQIISKEAEEKMFAMVTDITPAAFRLPITENLTSKRLEVKEVKNVFMQRVFPKVEEKP